jgi:hypothetical protein
MLSARAICSRSACDGRRRLATSAGDRERTDAYARGIGWNHEFEALGPLGLRLRQQPSAEVGALWVAAVDGERVGWGVCAVRNEEGSRARSCSALIDPSARGTRARAPPVEE